jgi:Activator of Hsp90 ATPase homolog 1-like protein
VIEAPHRLVCRQVMSVSNGSSVETRVTVTFEERDGQTLLALLEAGYPTEAQRDEFERGWPDFLDAYQRSLVS